MRVKYLFSSRRTGRIEGTNQHKKQYPALVREVIRISDIILEVLDARFIEETRNKELEELIKSQGKKLIYVLNKADLVDINGIVAKIELQKLYPYVFVSCKFRKGTNELRNRIKIEVKKLETPYKKAQVGVIGYPNTGKSSVINLLIGRTSAKVSPQSGFTKGMQKLRLTSEILLLDTPGVIPDKEMQAGNYNIAKHTRIGVRTWDKVKDPDFMVAKLMQKYPDIFEKFYKIEAKGNSEVLIEQIGRRKNLIRKGNEVDIDKAARIVLRDWQEGKINLINCHINLD